ncbi:S66 peptidase family protein [Catenuloplanes indicus]|uniref:Muramoyltetrapeptide carboxypeptidase n=1 Tax=Catenuloplanes indicus TaxID=137267 RepID=A0AAE3VZV8_9ACTN|nr:LD-carboxypeptidase [Catenuloplanes indicus]MDQ0366876.1 muramoyltetrapeptide carboxypeptidase [Catenuloplanes indicus]
METSGAQTVYPPRLRPGDLVKIVSPACPPSRDGIDRGVEVMRSWGLRVEVGVHVFDSWGYMAGTDADRLADLNEAFRDPQVRAIVTSRGGKGTYRIIGGLDFDAIAADPKPVVGFSDVTHLHLALWARCRVTGVHGPFANWSDDWSGPDSAEALRRALMTTDPVVLHRDPHEATAAVQVDGVAEGPLVGGNLDAIRTTVGAGLPSLAGAILFLEHQKGTGLGEVDRALTQMMGSGQLDGLHGVVLGQFLGFEDIADDPTQGGWHITDILRDRLTRLDVPVLGGIPAGHGFHPPTIPLGPPATIDTTAGTLTVASAVK